MIWLQAQGADYLQGFFLARPEPKLATRIRAALE